MLIKGNKVSEVSVNINFGEKDIWLSILVFNFFHAIYTGQIASNNMGTLLILKRKYF